MNYYICETGLRDSYYITNYYAGDHRGYFIKTFEKEDYLGAGIDFDVSETFMTKSAKNVIRGLHFQTFHPQAKLVTVVQGRAWDVIVDLRQESPSFAKWTATELTEDNHISVYIPKGFAHGFLSLADNTIMLYQCSGKYDSASDTGIIFNDPDINIRWPIDGFSPIHSDRDLKFGSLIEYLKNPMIP